MIAQIGVEEYRSRQAALRELARGMGLDLAVAWSRGGGTQDHSADVLYLTGFYTPQPFVPDLAAGSPGGSGRDWRWRAAGHAAAVVETDGPVTAVVDNGNLQDPQPVADAVVVSADPVEAVADLILAGGRGRGDGNRNRAGLLGGEALAARWARRLAQRLGDGIELVEADELSWGLRTIKSPAERSLLRASGRARGARHGGGNVGGGSRRERGRGRRRPGGRGRRPRGRPVRRRSVRGRAGAHPRAIGRGGGDCRVHDAAAGRG